jgi:DNA-directed RNA polymerase specialized sigma24 family protein
MVMTSGNRYVDPEELTEAVRAWSRSRNDAVLQHIHDAFIVPICRLVRRRFSCEFCGDVADLEGAAVTSCLIAILCWDESRLMQPTSTFNFLTSCARNAMRDESRKARRSRRRNGELVRSAETDPTFLRLAIRVGFAVEN